MVEVFNAIIDHINFSLKFFEKKVDVSGVKLRLYVCSSVVDQSHGSGVHRAAGGVDSEGDEYEDDQDSETSDDSDPELVSPCLIRQTNLSMSEFFLPLYFSSATI